MNHRMAQPTNASLRELIAGIEPPCLSLYPPTHRHHPENGQDPIRFRNLVKELEKSLGQKYSAVEDRPLQHRYAPLRHGLTHDCHVVQPEFLRLFQSNLVRRRVGNGPSGVIVAFG